MAKDNDKQLITLDDSAEGVVKIADEVVAIIAAYATTEVEGVAAMAGNITSSIMNKVGMKSLSNGVRVFIEGNQVRADVAIMVAYGYSIPTTSRKVQDKIKASIENMTGLEVTDVNIRVVGVKMAGSEEEA